MTWRDLAACLGTDPRLFFPETGEPAEPAKAICAVCPVVCECLEDAIAMNERDGIRGGITGRKRDRMARARRMKAPHGTRQRYNNGNCRCELCTAANTEYVNRLRHGQPVERTPNNGWHRMVMDGR